MTRTLSIRWDRDRTVPAKLAVPNEPRSPAVLYAPGAGAGQAHPNTVRLRSALAAAGHPVMTFDYPYAAEGRRRPDRPSVLLACHRAAARRLAGYGWPVVLAGRSMGGRLASHLASGTGPDGAPLPGGPVPCVGVMCHAYPLVVRSGPRDVSHFASIAVPVLLVSGTRDPMAPPERLRRAFAGGHRISIELVPEADHGFRVPRRIATPDEVQADLASRSIRWLGQLGGGT